MPRTDPDALGENFRWRLRAELNRVRPVYSPPRYLAPARERTGAMRVATAVLAVAVVGILSLTAYKTAGSPNPSEWTRKIVTGIEPTTQSTPTPVTSSSPSPQAAAPVPPTHSAQSTPRVTPSDRPQSTPTPEHEPGDDQRASGSRTVSPSPGAGDH